MASLKILLYKSNRNSEGQYPVALRIIKNRVPKYINIAWIDEKHWNAKDRVVKKSHVNHLQINNKADSKLALARKLITNYESENKEYDLNRLVQKIKGDRVGIGFFKFAQEHIDSLKRRKKFGTLRSVKPSLQRFKDFTNDKEIVFEEITPRLLKKFIAYLEEKEYAQTTISSNLSFIRNMYNDAIDEDLVKADLYPFGKKDTIKIKKVSTAKIGLNTDELIKIEQLELKEGTKIWHTQKVFLFSFYLAGMRIGDVLTMKWNRIQNGRLYYSMKKNGKYDSLQLPEKAIQIIESYRPQKKSANDFVFPHLKEIDTRNLELLDKKMDNAKSSFNYYLKQVAKKANIEKKLSCHIARHSFGNISGDKIPIQSLQKLYRHSDIQTTINYQSHFDHSKTDEALNNVLNF